MTRQDWLHKWCSYALALLGVWWLDAYLLSRWPVFGVTPILLPVAVTAVSVLEGVAGGAGFGFGAGLLFRSGSIGEGNSPSVRCNAAQSMVSPPRFFINTHA